MRRELHVLLLLDLSLLVETEQIGDRVAEDEGPDRQREAEELYHAEGEVVRQRPGDE